MRFVLALLFLVRLAHADVGVVVSGDPNMQARVLDTVQRWLQDRKLTLVASPLGGSTTTLVDCFVIEDMACARKVFEEQAKAATVVFVRVDMTASNTRDYTIAAYWFAKGAEPVTEKRSCNQCDDNALDAVVGSLMGDLTRKGTHGKGLLKVNGSGAGMMLKIDGTEAGPPPLSRELDAGSHELVFLHDGTAVEVRRVEVEAGGIHQLETPHVAERQPGPTGHRSRKLPALLMAGGLVAAAAGGVFLYYGSLRGPDEPYEYKNATEIGIPLALAGAFAVGAGVSLWFAGSGSDAQAGVSGTF